MSEKTTNTAILLAAGSGSRLRPITNNIPKPMANVNGEMIISRALKNLSNKGLNNIIIVTGYLGDKIRDFFGSEYKGMGISYIHNSIYESTNSMYSLWMALKALSSNERIIVIEGDVFFEESILDNIPDADFLWYGDSGIMDMDGCYLTSEEKKINEIKIYRNNERNKVTDKFLLKSLGLLIIKPKLIDKIVSVLEEDIANKKENLYYDLIFAERLNHFNIQAVDVKGKKWFEIDTPEDIKICEQLL